MVHGNSSINMIFEREILTLCSASDRCSSKSFTRTVGPPDVVHGTLLIVFNGVFFIVVVISTTNIYYGMRTNAGLFVLLLMD